MRCSLSRMSSYPYRKVVLAVIFILGFGGLVPLPFTKRFTPAAFASAIDPAITLVSVNSSGNQVTSPGGSDNPSMSADGRYVAFLAWPSLASTDGNDEFDIYVRDRQAETTTHVSISASGGAANGYSDLPSVSANGRYIAFQSGASNLVSGDNNSACEPNSNTPGSTANCDDVFVRDLLAGTTELVSVSSSEEQGNAESYHPRISADGRYVVFESSATNLVAGDTNGWRDVFVRDRVAGTTTRVSVNSSAEQGSGPTGAWGPAISADGRYIAFVSDWANLVANDTNGKPDIFVHDRQTGATSRVSVSSSGAQAQPPSSNFGIPRAEISGNGRYVAWRSAATNLVVSDTNGTEDLFMHDRQTGTTSLVAVNQSGAQGNGTSEQIAFSSDGRYAAFSSGSSNLVLGDTCCLDVFVRDFVTNEVIRVSVNAAGEQANTNSAFGQLSISSDGRFVAFDSFASNLVPSDANGQVLDVFVRDRSIFVPETQTFGGGDSPHSENTTAMQSDPVNSATGSFYTSVADVALPGIGLPFAFTRAYNSADTTAGPLGPGWTHSYAASLAVDPLLGDITLRAENGQQILYRRQIDDSFAGAPGARSTLAAITGGYKLTRRDQVVYSFDSEGKLTKIRDRNGNDIDLAYDASDRLDTMTDAAGRVIDFTHNASGLLTGIELPDGRDVSYAYTSGRLTQVTDLRGGTTAYAYTSGRLSSITDQLGNVVVQNAYGSDGRVTEQTDALGNESTFAWDAATQTSTMTDARGNQWKDVYKNNILLRRVDPLGNTVKLERDQDLNLVKVTDPRNKVWTMTHDDAGNLLTRTAPAPLSYVESFTYNANDQVASVTDPRGNTTTFDYDAAGNLTKMTQPGSVITEVDYVTGTGQLESITDPRGKTTTFDYDSDGNLIEITTPTGSRTTMNFDSSGRMTSLVEPRGNEAGNDPNDYRWTYEHDAGGHVLSTTDPFGNETSRVYDAVGNVISQSDALGRITQYTFNAARELTKVTAPDETKTSYTYDAVGNLISRTDPKGRITSYVYDTAYRLIQMISPLGQRWTYQHDAAGNLIKSVDAKGNATTTSGDGTIEYAYDAVGRITTINYSDSTPDVTFAYDENGNRTQMTDGVGTQTHTFDALNRLTAVTRGSNVFSYLYDAAGNITRRTYSDGTQMDYGYDDNGRLSTVTTGTQITTYSYDAAGNLISTLLPNAAIETRTYDRAARLARVRSVHGTTTLADAIYTRDAVGNPTKIVTPEGAQVFAYDEQDRLTKVCYADECGPAVDFIRYEYDKNGNRVREKRPLGATTYTYNAGDQLVASTHRAGPVAGVDKLISSFDVPGNSSVGVQTPPLLTGSEYRIKVTGTYQYGALSPSFKADAECSITLGDSTWKNDRYGSSTADPTDDPTDLYVSDGVANGSLDGPVAWQPIEESTADELCAADPAHTYEYRFIAQAGGPLNFKINDSNSDNSGALHVEVYQEETGPPDFDFIGRVVIPSTDADGVQTSALAPGVDYKLKVTGTYEYNNTAALYDADAECSRGGFGGNFWAPDRYTSGGNDLLDLHASDGTVNGTLDGELTWQTPDAASACAADPAHTYEHRFTAQTAAPVTLKINDNYFPDNAGALTADLYQQVQTVTYEYDKNGNQIRVGARTFDYDLAGRQTAVDVGATEVSYDHDGDGVRLQAEQETETLTGTETATKKFSWDRNAPLPRLALEHDGSGQLLRRYVKGLDTVSMKTGGEDFYYHRDGLGSVLAVSDAAATPQWNYSYEPFGSMRVENRKDLGAPANPLGFTGEYLDQETGHYHLRARQYDPSIGRFTATDPVSSSPAMPYVSSYSYVGNRATILRDPSGMRATGSSGTSGTGGYLCGVSGLPTCPGDPFPISCAAGQASMYEYLSGIACPPAGFAGTMGYHPQVIVGKFGTVMADPYGACSSKWWIFGPGNTGASFDFTDACKAHDYAYDLLRYFGSIGSPLGQDARKAADALFGEYTIASCEGRSASERPRCLFAAEVFVDAVITNSIIQDWGVPT